MLNRDAVSRLKDAAGDASIHVGEIDRPFDRGDVAADSDGCRRRRAVKGSSSGLGWEVNRIPNSIQTL